jgi:hypothetical protein
MTITRSAKMLTSIRLSQCMFGIHYRVGTRDTDVFACDVVGQVSLGGPWIDCYTRKLEPDELTLLWAMLRDAERNCLDAIRREVRSKKQLSQCDN